MGFIIPTILFTAGVLAYLVERLVKLAKRARKRKRYFDPGYFPEDLRRKYGRLIDEYAAKIAAAETDEDRSKLWMEFNGRAAMRKVMSDLLQLDRVGS